MTLAKSLKVITDTLDIMGNDDDSMLYQIEYQF